MGSQMKHFVEDALIIKINRSSKGKLDPSWLNKVNNQVVEQAFWQFVWLHEVLLPIGFYSNTIEIQVISQITIELLQMIDAHLYEHLKEDIKSFINN